MKAFSEDIRCSHALGVCQKVMSAFSMSWKQRRELTKAQINLELKQQVLVSVSLHAKWQFNKKGMVLVRQDHVLIDNLIKNELCTHGSVYEVS